ncbi:MAG: DUF2141 domain-containing protein [Bacteroidota bacterium]|nr:DUF2141 domain-containing protein [Candidatus Kapabacteria bacterium]MDW8219821.1 DUF2141 domain-containing protein [Bacteroidota bacterium]
MIALCTIAVILTTHIISADGNVSLVSSSSLTIIVPNVPSSKGMVRAALYNSPQEFPRGKVWKETFAVASSGETVLRFENVPAGEYAIALFHDENGNTKMDYNFIGMPVERYGFSNNVRATLSAPDFSQAKFTVRSGVSDTLRIRLQ